MTELHAKVAEIAACPANEVTDSFDLSLLDSLGRAELIIFVEETIGRELTNAEILEAKTLKDLKAKFK